MTVHVNETTLPALKQIASLPAVKQLNLCLDFDPDWDQKTDDRWSSIDLDFKLKLPTIEESTISFQSEIKQEKQLRSLVLMLASMKHLKSLVFFGLNREGASYINSIAEDLPTETWVTFGNDDDKIELSAPMKRLQEFPIPVGEDLTY